MKIFRRGRWIGWTTSAAVAVVLSLPGVAAAERTTPVVVKSTTTLAGTEPLRMAGGRSEQMVAGISRFLDTEIAKAREERGKVWRADFSTEAAHAQSVQPNRERFSRIIGLVDRRLPNPEMEYVASVAVPALIGETSTFTAYAVRWPTLDGVFGEGVLLQPKGKVRARVVAIPDADQTPELICGLVPGLADEAQFARRLAESGCQVVIPTLINRADTLSGSVTLNRLTNLPHREWIYRQAFQMGRHVIGYEVQKVLAAVDWMQRQEPSAGTRIGVVGYGEGGLLALYAAAADARIHATLVSGYFNQRDRVWAEPIYRNVFGLLSEFGDAEIAQLIIPRQLIVQSAAVTSIDGPPAPRSGRSGAAPGRITTPEENAVRAEIARAQKLAGKWSGAIRWHAGDASQPAALSQAALLDLARALDSSVNALPAVKAFPAKVTRAFDFEARQERQVREVERHVQRLLSLSADARNASFWQNVPITTPENWRTAMIPFREKFTKEVMGRYATGKIAPQPRSRLLYDEPTWTGYEVMLDVLPDVFAWGYFLVPKNMKPGEKRPVVVAQHGLEGLPEDLVNEDQSTRSYAAYKAFATRLVERGFIVFAPHNPYRGADRFRELQRKANPLGKSLFSFIIAQNDVILDWLVQQPNVDAARIGYYGLSYGGKSAMRIPAILDRFAVSICSGDFNEWIWKNVTVDFRGSYVFTGEYEMPDFNLGYTFNYAEMAAMIAPRPFMVERGHNDGVGVDEWVAFEYAKVNRLYSKLKISPRTEIEYFDGPHTINGVGSYRFLHRHLNWPEPKP